MIRINKPRRLGKRKVLRRPNHIILGQAASNKITGGRWIQPHFRTASYKPGSS